MTSTQLTIEQAIERQQASNARPMFDGPDYKPELDDARLTGQIKRIYELMKDQNWRTLAEIEAATGDPQASISSQLRHLKKRRFGSHGLNKRRRGDPKRGLWEYSLIPNRTDN